MEEDLNKDGLEEFFKGRLEHYEEDPGDALWGSLQEQIPPKPKHWFGGVFGGKFLLALPIAVFIALLSMLYMQQLKTQQLLTKVAVQEDKIEQLELSLEQKLDEIGEEKTKPIASPQVNEREQTGKQMKTQVEEVRKGTKTEHLQRTTAKNNSKKITSKNGSTELEKEQNIPQIEQKNSPSTEKILPEKIQVQANATKGEPVSNLETLVAWNPLIALEMPFSILEREDTLALDFTAAKSKGGSKLYYNAGGLVGTTFFSFPSVFKSSFSTDVGFYLHAAFELNDRWAIVSGIQMINKNIQLTLNQNFTYQPIGELNSDGERNHRYEINLEDIFLLKTNFLYKEDIVGNLLEGDPFFMESKVDYNLRYFQIPLLLRYKVGEGTIASEFQGGIIYNHLFGGKSELQSVSFSDPRVRVQSYNLEPVQLNNTFTEITFGNILVYKFHPKIHFSADFQIRYSLGRILGQKTFATGLGLGIRYQF